MSTLSSHANRIVAVLAAAALAYALRLPWYAPAGVDPTATDGPVEQFAWHLARVFRTVGGTRTGEAAAPGGSLPLLVVAGLTAVLALVLLVKATGFVGDALRLVGLVPVLLVLGAALSRPSGLTVHWGLLVAAITALVLANAAWHGGAVRPKPATVLR